MTGSANVDSTIILPVSRYDDEVSNSELLTDIIVCIYKEPFLVIIMHCCNLQCKKCDASVPPGILNSPFPSKD